MNFSKKQLIALVVVLIISVVATVAFWDTNHPQGTVEASGYIYGESDGDVVVVGRSYADIVITAIPDYNGG